MPKLSEHIRFPQSMKLFQFCFRVLKLRSPLKKIRDQHLGALLNLSPSSTSHWKNGKKDLKNLKHIERLSQNLNIDLDTLHDLAEGSIALDEALFDFYDSEEISRLLKEQSCQTTEDMHTLEQCALSVWNQISIKEIPIHISELITAFPFIQLLPSDTIRKFASSARLKPGSYIIRYPKGDARPHTRLGIAREIANIILTSEHERYKLSPYSEPYSNIAVITLSNAFLIPLNALACTMQNISTRINPIKLLSEKFCVPKSAIRQRLATLLIESATRFNKGSFIHE